MTETLRPTVVIEGRAPLEGQLVTRQTFIPAELANMGVDTVYVQAEDPSTYGEAGCIRAYTAYGSETPTEAVLEPGTYAWRLRDPVWADGDRAAFPDGDGYNSQRARADLATRRGFANVLAEMGLGVYGVDLVDAPEAQGQQARETLFVKPDRINDISERLGTRARLVHGNVSRVAMAGVNFDAVVLQRLESTVAARDLADHLDVSLAAGLPGDTLHAVRIFAPLWLPAADAPAVELRLTDPHEDVGKFFATQQYLLEPEHVRGKLPQLAALHRNVHTAFRARYGEQNYLTFDYLIRPDGSVRVLNGLVRGLTPNLEHQRPEVQHLANATANVEVKRLARVALSIAGQ